MTVKIYRRYADFARTYFDIGAFGSQNACSRCDYNKRDINVI